MINKQDEEDVNEVDVEEGVDSPEATDTEDENDTQPLSSDGENEEEEESEESEEEEEGEEDNDASPTPEDETEEASEETEPLEVEGARANNETMREYALRKELENTRKMLRKEKEEDLFVKKREPQPSEDDILSEYDQEEVGRLEKIISKLGYVKEADLSKKTYESSANGELSAFLDSHPEYLAENDKDGVLWNEFRNEFNLYKTPESPKEYKKIFERIHLSLKAPTTVDIKKINASREKLKVASHNGAAKIGSNPQRKSQNTSGIRTDMLQGFSDEEKAELLS